ncbi:MAG: GNAT family N-acetyltransferase, partial [Acidobacteriota bacterium]|nr:GNAT family N-acetyltransferase [Acidobacteriota bacterium]
MPFQPELTRTTAMVTTTTTTTVTTSDWKAGLPVMAGTGFSLRELRLDDAASLLAMLTTEEVSRFISPPPTTVEGFERFILWAQRERQAGNYACFAVVPAGMDTAIGIF